MNIANIPKPGPGEAIIIRPDGSFRVVSLAELEQLKRGDNGIPDEPIASISVSVENFDEGVKRVLDVLRENNNEHEE